MPPKCLLPFSLRLKVAVLRSSLVLVSVGSLFQACGAINIKQTVSGQSPPSKAAGRSQVFNVFSGALRLFPRGIYHPTTMALCPLLIFIPPPFSSALFPFYPSLWFFPPRPFHPLLGEATPFNRLGSGEARGALSPTSNLV